MELLKTFFPISFGCKDKNALVTLVVCFVIIWVVCGVAGWILGKIPVVNIISGLVLGLVGLYALITLILGILVFCGVLNK